MFEQLLLGHLLGCDTELSQHLARWNDEMAIFIQEAPPDTDEGWGKGSQYGRIVFSVNMQDNAERIVSGILTVDVICQSGLQDPSEMENIVKPLIDGYFFTGTNHTIAAQWSASNYFTDPTKEEDGVTIAFSLIAFPVQASCEPDPIQLLNRYTKEIIPNSCVIGLDNITTVWKPSNTVPAIYWRLVDISPCSWIPSTYACEWQTALCQAHILAPDKEIETITSRTLDNGFSFKKSLCFSDGTYMRVDRNIRINPGADALKQGQVSLEATYGILRDYSSEKLKEIHISDRLTSEGGN